MNQNNQKIALITGVTGQDGSWLADFLLFKGYKVIGLRRRTSTFNTNNIEHLRDNERFITEWCDVTDSSSLWRVLTKYKFDEIYHLAAQSHVRVSFDLSENTFDITAGGTLKLLNVIKEVCPQTKVYIAGSSEQFGDTDCVPQNENTKFQPASPYACAKVFATHIARNYRESYGMFISVGILFNHESERRCPTFVTRKITRSAARIKLGLEDSITLGNLSAKRDWSHADDMVKGMWMMLQQEKPDDYILASFETHSVKEFLDETFKLAKLNVHKHLKTDSRLLRPQEVPLLLGDYSKAKAILGWEPKVKFLELIRIMYIHDLKEQAKLNNIQLTEEMLDF